MGLTTSQVAAELGAPEATVSVRLMARIAVGRRFGQRRRVHKGGMSKMPRPDEPDRLEEEIDSLAREADAFLSTHHPWDLSAEDVTATTGHCSPVRAKTAVATVLVATAIIVVFAATP